MWSIVSYSRSVTACIAQVEITMPSEPSTIKGSFLATIKLLTSISGKKKQRVASLMKLSDQKLKELETTHELFVLLLHSLGRSAAMVSEKLHRSDDIEGAREEL
jgi:hypothetical protein